MVATDYIAAAAKINSSYLPGGANVHFHVIHGFLGICDSAPKQHIGRFSCFAGLSGVPKTQTDRRTMGRATCAAIDRIHAGPMHAVALVNCTLF